MSQCSPKVRRSGEPGPSPALEREQQPPGDARLRLLLYPRQHGPGSAPEGRGEAEGGGRSPMQKPREPLPGLSRAAALNPEEKERF